MIYISVFVHFCILLLLTEAGFSGSLLSSILLKLQNEFSIFSGGMLIISAELNIGCELYTSKRQFISIDLSKLNLRDGSTFLITY